MIFDLFLDKNGPTGKILDFGGFRTFLAKRVSNAIRFESFETKFGTLSSRHIF